MTARERSLVERGLEALEDGDDDFAVELLLIALDDKPVRDDDSQRCGHGLWPGEQWRCHCNVAEQA